MQESVSGRFHTWLRAVRRATAVALWPEFMRPSPYRDSVAFGIECVDDLTPLSFGSESAWPIIHGQARIYKGTEPRKIIVTEMIICTWTRKGQSVKTAASVETASDLRLVSAYVGSKNCLPTAPTQSTGLSGQVFARDTIGNGIAWPTIAPGVDVVISFAVCPTVLYRCTPPKGFRRKDLRTVRVHAHFNVLGEACEE